MTSSSDKPHRVTTVYVVLIGSGFDPEGRSYRVGSLYRTQEAAEYECDRIMRANRYAYARWTERQLA